MNRKKIFISIIFYVQLIVISLIVIYPLIWVLGTSFSDSPIISRATAIPENLTFDNYKRLFSDTNYLKWYGNTFYVAILTMIFSVILNVTTSFIFARYSFKGKKIGLLTLSILQLFPSFLGLTALYMVALTFNLLNNLNSLVILYVAGGIPGNIWIVKGYMNNISKSLDEAAYIDGATKIQMFWKILFPLSLPILSIIAITSFMGPWIDYILPRFLINSDVKKTLAVGLFEFVDPIGSKYDFRAFTAGAILIGLPIASLYIYLQKFLISGMTAGATKGD